MKKLNVIIYSLIALIVLIIIFMIFVQFDFRDFVHELDQKNAYFYKEDGRIKYGFTSPPYIPLSEEKVNSLSTKDLLVVEPLGYNLFYFNKQALVEKDIPTVELVEKTYSKDEAIALLDSQNLSFTSRTNVFAALAEEFDSEYIFGQYKKGNFEPYPNRLLWKFIKVCPKSLTKFFTFKREVSI
ncbi:hypothetical protein KY335_01445 [Candidatus Woesearchaeota archaeon]|nr:hypothetical protein [Candidatus Woesearchaeota archaeon]